MIAFDADVLTEILAGHVEVVARASSIPATQQAIPIIVVEELIRGRLNAVRQAESGNWKLSLPRAYELLEETMAAVRVFQVLAYTPSADELYRSWRASKVRGGTHDLRIAATCIVHSAKLVTRNRRDFESLPGLKLDVWA